MMQELVPNKVRCRFFDKTFDTPYHYYVHKNPDQPSCSVDVVKDNCQRVVNKMNATGLVLVRQVHGNDVYFATSSTEYGLEPEVDAVVTTIPGMVLAIYTADCVPVLFACKSGKVIGAAHCGWKSTKLNIISKVIKDMQEVGAKDIVAIIGPSIQQKSYEVDKAYRDSFVTEDEGSASFFKKGREGHFFFDLPGYVERKLNLAGVTEVQKHSDDTYEMEDKYYSRRRSFHRDMPYDGNLLSTIVIA